MNVIFRPPAVEDTVEAAAWYEERAPGLGDELIDEILAAADRATKSRIISHRSPSRQDSPGPHKSLSLSHLFLSRRRNSLLPRRSPWRATRSPLD